MLKKALATLGIELSIEVVAPYVIPALAAVTFEYFDVARFLPYFNDRFRTLFLATIASALAAVVFTHVRRKLKWRDPWALPATGVVSIVAFLGAGSAASRWLPVTEFEYTIERLQEIADRDISDFEYVKNAAPGDERLAAEDRAQTAKWVAELEIELRYALRQFRLLNAELGNAGFRDEGRSYSNFFADFYAAGESGTTALTYEGTRLNAADRSRRDPLIVSHRLPQPAGRHVAILNESDPPAPTFRDPALRPMRGLAPGTASVYSIEYEEPESQPFRFRRFVHHPASQTMQWDAFLLPLDLMTSELQHRPVITLYSDLEIARSWVVAFPDTSLGLERWPLVASNSSDPSNAAEQENFRRDAEPAVPANFDLPSEFVERLPADSVLRSTRFVHGKRYFLTGTEPHWKRSLILVYFRGYEDEQDWPLQEANEN